MSHLALMGAGGVGVVAPEFVSAEIGSVNVRTVAVTFSSAVTATNYATGITITDDGAGATISLAQRQADHKVVYYLLSAAVAAGSTVTIAYNAATGNIVGETGALPLATFAAQTVTDNIGDYDIELDRLTTYGTWSDWAFVAETGALVQPLSGSPAATLGYSNYWPEPLLTYLADAGFTRMNLNIPWGVEHDDDHFADFLTNTITYNQWAAFSREIVLGSWCWTYLDYVMDNLYVPFKARLTTLGKTARFQFRMGSFGTNTGPWYFWSNPDDWADWVVAIYDHLSDTYGFAPYCFEVNEPDNCTTGLTTTQLADALAAIATALAAAGYTPRFLVPCGSTASASHTWFDAVRTRNGDAWCSQYIEEYSYHNYAGYVQADLQEIATNAAALGIKTSMTEHIAADYAELYNDIVDANISAHTQYTAAYPTADNGAQYFPVSNTVAAKPVVYPAATFKYLEQYMRAIPRGAQRFRTLVDNANLKATAWDNGGNYAVLINAAAAVANFTLHNLPAGTYEMSYTTTAGEVAPTRTTVVANGTLTLTIPAAGVYAVWKAASGTRFMVRLTPTADTSIGATIPTFNNGAAPYVLLGLTSKALFRFDLSRLSSTYTLLSAKLRLFHLPAGAALAFTASAYSIAAANNAWIEGTQNYVQALAGEPTWDGLAANGSGGVTTAWAGSAGLSTAGVDYENTVLGTFSGDRSDAANTPYVMDLDLTRIKAWFDTPNTNYGLLITATAASGGMNSREYVAVAQKFPVLDLEIQVP